MNKYQIKITLRSPVCIAKKRGTGNVIETLDYIPGSTIRGALADMYLKKNPSCYDVSTKTWKSEEKQQEFERLFLSDEVRYGNCYPEGARVTPLTASSCKYSPGFYTGQNFRDQHGIADLLKQLILYDMIGKRIDGEYEYCGYCGAPLDRAGGYYKNMNEKVEVSKRLVTRTQVGDLTERAYTGNLYTLETINEKRKGNFQEFIGEVELADQDLLGNLIPFSTIEEIRIGLSKSRGLGHVEIMLEDAKSSWGEFEIPDVSDRIQTFNDNLGNQGFFFSITFHSDIILLDDLMRFKTAIDVADLGLNPDWAFKLLRSWVNVHSILGWNSVLKLPKEEDIAIGASSVFVYHTTKALKDNEREALAKDLKELEEDGLGERKNEGFGKIRICDEWHLKEGPQ